MQLQGEYVVHAPRDRVWQLLNDPAVLARITPGVTSLIPDGDDRYKATFVVAPSIKSPMAYGLAALSSHSAAERLAADHHGTVHDWDGAMEQAEHRGQE